MAMNVSRWLKYAKAKLDATVSSANEELDHLEARQQGERADRPWLGDDRTAPTFEQAQARIRWQADQAEQAGRSKAAEPGGREGPGDSALTDPAAGRTSGDVTAPDPVGPLTGAEAAEQHAARLELDERAQRSAARLEQIRRELGVDDPTPGPGDQA